MNVFILSPGRTATTTLSEAFSCVKGWSSAHESRSQLLGDERVNYPEKHLEFDNRLTWFLPRLTKKYSSSALLVIVQKKQCRLASSYNKRWYKMNIMKSYSQGILMRDLKDNNLDVCKDYVSNVYEHLEYVSKDWMDCIYLDIDNPEEGVVGILNYIGGTESDLKEILEFLKTTVSNKNEFSLYQRLSWVWFAFRFFVGELKCALR